MARETVAQRNARMAAEREARLVAEREAYPARLMALLEQVSNEPQFELSVKNGFFNVQDRNDRYRSEYELSYSWSEHAQETMNDLTWKVEQAEQERAEAARRVAVKKEAERKVRELLSEEERELLGL